MSDQDILEQLRASGLRMTPQRRMIVTEIMRAKGHINAADITRKVQGQMPGVNASTVYRTLSTLEDAGILSHAHLESGPEYHRAEEGQHVHLVCSNCGTEDELTLPEADRLHTLLRKHKRFEPNLSHFAISGLCANCQ